VEGNPEAAGASDADVSVTDTADQEDSDG
jgi:hypothetical protein